MHCCTCGSCDPKVLPCGSGGTLRHPGCVRFHAHLPEVKRAGGACLHAIVTNRPREVRGHGSSIVERELASRKTHTQKQHIHNIPYTVYTIIRYYALQYLLITITLTFIRCGRSAYLCQAPFTAACSRRQSSSSLTLDFLHFIPYLRNLAARTPGHRGRAHPLSHTRLCACLCVLYRHIYLFTGTVDNNKQTTRSRVAGWLARTSA